MAIGTLIRLAVALAWMALFIPHVVAHLAPGLGARAATSATFAANLGKEFIYELGRANGSPGFGSCTLGFTRDEQGFVLETALRIDDLGNLAPGLELLPQLRSASSREVRLDLAERLDGGQRLRSIAITGRVFAMDLKADGTVADDGLRGTYTFADAPATPFHLPEVGADAGQGSDLALNLPPGLEPGDRFTTRLLSPDYAKLRLGAATAVFTALTREQVATAAGPLPLLKVEMVVDARVVSTLWCDGAGVVYRSRQQAGGLELRLLRIRVRGGEILWPPTEASR